MLHIWHIFFNAVCNVYIQILDHLSINDFCFFDTALLIFWECNFVFMFSPQILDLKMTHLHSAQY